MSIHPSNDRCPVCRFPGVEAYDSNGRATFDICPCCGTEFGLDDATTSHDDLRAEWIDQGMPWWSTANPPPPGWQPDHQLGDDGATPP